MNIDAKCLDGESHALPFADYSDAGMADTHLELQVSEVE